MTFYVFRCSFSCTFRDYHYLLLGTLIKGVVNDMDRIVPEYDILAGKRPNLPAMIA